MDPPVRYDQSLPGRGIMMKSSGSPAVKIPDVLPAVASIDSTISESETRVLDPKITTTTITAPTATTLFNNEAFIAAAAAAAATTTTVAGPATTDEQVTKTILEQQGYNIIGHIGNGSFAKVKKATSIKEKKVVAIKFISKSKTPSDYLTKFLPREIDVVRGLDHPNIIKYYRCIETTRRVYIVMQFADNGSLLDLIRRRSQLTEHEARAIYRQLLSALEYCHGHGIVHRDIKCENLLFDSENVLKLIDFGFARRYFPLTTTKIDDAAPAPASPTTTTTTTATTVNPTTGRIGTSADESNNKKDIPKRQLSETYCGSYAYACPEILIGEPYDPRHADIWASGVVLFAMVFGRLPFDDADFGKLVKQVYEKINFSTRGLAPVSELCKACIQRIISPRNKILLTKIREDPWMQITAIL